MIIVKRMSQTLTGVGPTLRKDAVQGRSSAVVSLDRAESSTLQAECSTLQISPPNQIKPNQRGKRVYIGKGLKAANVFDTTVRRLLLTA